MGDEKIIGEVTFSKPPILSTPVGLMSESVRASVSKLSCLNLKCFDELLFRLLESTLLLVST